MSQEEIPRIKGCLVKETEKEILRIELEKEADLENLARKVGSPIFDCTKTGDTFIINPKNKVQYIFKKKRTR